MGCIVGNIRIGAEELKGSMSFGSPLSGALDVVSAAMVGCVSNIPMKGSISLVCPLPRYVFVQPEIIWLNEGNAFSMDVDVKSNTDWYIE